MKSKITDVIWTILLLGLTAVFSAGHAFAQSDTWTPTGSMAGARDSHTATLLINGKVLIPGSFNTVAELYDPTTETFNLTGTMLFAHGQGATANRLPDGRVLIVGGNGAPASAEIYDPATETFSATGDLNARHNFHTATLLPDGRVLIAGGNGEEPGSNAISTDVAELYDPATGTFSLTGRLNSPRTGAAAALLPDGRVLIAGGTSAIGDGSGHAPTSSAELYNPASGTFNPTGNFMTQDLGPFSPQGTLLWWTGAPVLNNGTVLIVGVEGTQSAELFDPSTGTFSATGSMAVARVAHTATLLPDGQVLVVGGVAISIVGAASTLNSAELYDPSSETFTAAASMNEARQQHTATLLLHGEVLVTGGDRIVDGIGLRLNSAELFSGTVPFATVTIDITPGSFPNSINPRNKGRIAVAILTTGTFDATTVAPSTVLFGLTGTEAPPVHSALADVDGDGDTDMILHFNTQATGIQCGNTSASLTGETFDGQMIEGADSINTVGCK